MSTAQAASFIFLPQDAPRMRHLRKSSICTTIFTALMYLAMFANLSTSLPWQASGSYSSWPLQGIGSGRCSQRAGVLAKFLQQQHCTPPTAASSTLRWDTLQPDRVVYRLV